MRNYAAEGKLPDKKFLHTEMVVYPEILQQKN